jgi:RHS repeat-associated protein
LLSGSAAAQDVVEYYQLDSVGNVLVVTNAQGAVVEEHDYLPFGEELCGTVPCSTLTGGQPRRFTGKERDAETGLDYFGARYYGSKIGRFTAVDPVYNWNANLLDPQRWNRYAYAKNNPLRFVDPNGEDVGEAAAWVQGQVSYASNFYIGAAVGTGNPLVAGSATFVASSLELGINGVADAFRVGESTGAALGRGDSGLAFAAAVSEDAGRAGGLILMAVGAARSLGAKGAGPYADIPDGPSVGPGKGYTQSQKAQIYAANREQNGGVLRSDCSGCELVPSQRSAKGVPTPSNAAQVDHHVPRSKGGPNSFGNARVLSAAENQKKGAN